MGVPSLNDLAVDGTLNTTNQLYTGDHIIDKKLLSDPLNTKLSHASKHYPTNPLLYFPLIYDEAS